ncbi:MAG TPA: Mur ligase family protein, partial [Candidatus Sulfotelmatobacter sp.]|nr:Mur ligase family protein [Candidatus Sulfotelmatobacter sp.]
TLRKTYPFDVAVLELGSDGPGQLKDFSYLNPDQVILSAIADEHMEYFVSLDAVAEEELAPLSFSKSALINIDDTPKQYLPKTEYQSYGQTPGASYLLASRSQDHLLGQIVEFVFPNQEKIQTEIKILGKQGALICLAAAASAHCLGWTTQDIKEGLNAITPVAGRMQILKGLNSSIVIDDTYNASPLAVKAALDVLYASQADKKIAILGSMNELGPVSKADHEEVGNYCDPNKLDLVVTIGVEAKKFLAPAAESKGCQVKTFLSPFEAGKFLKDQLTDKTLVLAKGSQNGVFAEEAVKQILADPVDADKLVRQTPAWLKIKSKQFS